MSTEKRRESPPARANSGRRCPLREYEKANPIRDLVRGGASESRGKKFPFLGLKGDPSERKTLTIFSSSWAPTNQRRRKREKGL